MGNFQPNAINSNNHYFAINFFSNDKLRLIAAPSDISHETESLIRSIWEIQDIYKVDGYIEFKLKGTPLVIVSSLFESGAGSSLKFKFLMCSLIKLYYRKGWHIKSTPVLQRYGLSGSSVIFERDIPLDTSIICLNLTHTDTIRFLGPDNMVPYLRSTILTYWHKGIQREGKNGESWEFKLVGNPWSLTFFNDYESTVAPVLVLQLFKCLHKLSWTYCGLIYSGNNNQGIYFRQSAKENFDFSNKNDSAPPSYSAATLEVPTESNHNSNYDFFAIQLTKTDRIRLIQPLPSIIELVRNSIIQSWPFGIQEQRAIDHITYEFKLKGNPWSAEGEESVLSRRLFNRLLGNLYENDCELSVNCSIYERIGTFIFRYNTQINHINLSISSNKVFCLSLNVFDKIRIINGDDTHTLTDMIRSSIQGGWPGGIQEENIYVNSYEFKLKGYPFQSISKDSVHICLFYMYLLYNLKMQKNISLYFTGDISNKTYTESNGNTHTTYYSDIHTLFFKFN